MKKKDKPLLITIIILIIIFLLKYIFTGSGIPCLIKKLTGYYCPFCGASRMFISIFKLDFYQAFRYNPLVFIYLIIFIILSIIYIILKLYKKNVNLNRKVIIIFFSLLFTIFIGFGIIRNINNFSYLLPTIVK